MKTRWASAFTVVELLIVVTVIAILAAITVVGYNGIRLAAANSVAREQLRHIGQAMELERVETGSFPDTIPDSVKSGGASGDSDSTGGGNSGSGGSTNVETIVKWSGVVTSYGALTDVQNGVLLAKTCQELISEGLGKGVDQGGKTQAYITGCGNWNHGSMQITGWDTKVWNTPVSGDQLLAYANAFTTSDTWNKAQIAVVKNFYTQLVQRQSTQGGMFPIKSFWDSWANSSNGGVLQQPLPSNPVTKETYCAEARTTQPVTVWHIGEDGVVREGECQR